MTLSEPLLAECHTMALAIAPELGSRPLYFVDAATIGDLLPRSTRCLGFALLGRIANANVADRLGSRWQGAGPIIVLDGQAIGEHALPGRFDACVRNVAIHELGHCLPPRPMIDFSRFAPPRFKERQQQALAAALTAPRRSIPRGQADPHDWRFCRYAVHLWCRARAARFDVPLDGLLTEFSYAPHYVEIVAGEALRLRDATFSEIAAEPPPVGLVEKYESDINYFAQKESHEHSNRCR